MKDILETLDLLFVVVVLLLLFFVFTGDPDLWDYWVEERDKLICSEIDCDKEGEDGESE